MIKRHKAGVTLDAVRDTVEKIHAAGLRAKGLFIFGLPGETPETLKTTSDFILSLDLDDMNMTKFSPMYGAPIWDECTNGHEGDFHEDWRLMNCLNFTFRPNGFSSRTEMDTLYNWHLRRFYHGGRYQRRMVRRLWEHRWSLWHIISHSFQAVQAGLYFNASRRKLARLGGEFPLHPRQPHNLPRPTTTPRQTSAARTKPATGFEPSFAK
jgi:magnesium-protoporphyrin IX monomethyl ester (oxidative) cyclase